MDGVAVPSDESYLNSPGISVLAYREEGEARVLADPAEFRDQKEHRVPIVAPT